MGLEDQKGSYHVTLGCSIPGSSVVTSMWWYLLDRGMNDGVGRSGLKHHPCDQVDIGPQESY